VPYNGARQLDELDDLAATMVTVGSGKRLVELNRRFHGLFIVVASGCSGLQVPAKSCLRTAPMCRCGGGRERCRVFDMGPGLDEILARCQDETGLPAPTRPAGAERRFTRPRLELP
jgi:hypothetical protein